MSKKLFLFCCVIALMNNLYSNAISVSNITVDPVSQEVNFDLEWQNSWRIDSMSAPLNWDAAWVFVKFSPCDSVSPVLFPDWEHGKLNTTISDHVFNDLEPVLPDGTIGIEDSLGVMLRRNSNGFFTNVGPTNITLHVNNLNPALTYHVRVVAIEMVYVTSNAFEIGGVTNTYRFDTTQIVNENAVTINSTATGLNSAVNLGANYPKGFDGFHCMKYEISHGQYATFLNTLNATQSANRYINTAASRHRLTDNGILQFGRYVSDREDRAYNYLGWDDFLAILDWSALAPMTELQYEKACRGTGNRLNNELAWGTTYINDGDQFTGAETGAEYFIDATANAAYNGGAYIAGDGGAGPARSGIFALPTNNTREQSGATYYGIMEMSGNVWEHIVNVSTHTDITGVTAFDGARGDGYLDPTGLWDTPSWPLLSFGNGIRGGAWSSTVAQLQVASRQYYISSGARSNNHGGRGIR